MTLCGRPFRLGIMDGAARSVQEGGASACFPMQANGKVALAKCESRKTPLACMGRSAKARALPLTLEDHLRVADVASSKSRFATGQVELPQAGKVRFEPQGIDLRESLQKALAPGS